MPGGPSSVMAPAAIRLIIGMVSSGSVLAQIAPAATIPAGVQGVMELGLTGAALAATWVLWRALVEERKASALAMAEERDRTSKAIAAKDTQILEMAKQVTQLLSAFSELRGEVKDMRDRDEHLGARRRPA